MRFPAGTRRRRCSLGRGATAPRRTGPGLSGPADGPSDEPTHEVDDTGKQVGDEVHLCVLLVCCSGQLRRVMGFATEVRSRYASRRSHKVIISSDAEFRQPYSAPSPPRASARASVHRPTRTHLSQPDPPHNASTPRSRYPAPSRVPPPTLERSFRHAVHRPPRCNPAELAADTSPRSPGPPRPAAPPASSLRTSRTAARPARFAPMVLAEGP